MGYANIGSANRGNKMQDKTKDQGIGTRDESADDAAEINEGDKGGGVQNCKCCGSECHIEWTDD